MANELARNDGPILALNSGSSSLKSARIGSAKARGSQQPFYAVGRLG
jgi:hypothetical protein